jgi:hypothetical protein
LGSGDDTNSALSGKVAEAFEVSVLREQKHFERIVKLPKVEDGEGVVGSGGDAKEPDVSLLAGGFEGFEGAFGLELLEGGTDLEKVEIEGVAADRGEGFDEVSLDEVGGVLLVDGALDLETALAHQEALVAAEVAAEEAGMDGEIKNGLRLGGGQGEGFEFGFLAAAFAGGDAQAQPDLGEGLVRAPENRVIEHLGLGACGLGCAHGREAYNRLGLGAEDEAKHGGDEDDGEDRGPGSERDDGGDHGGGSGEDGGFDAAEEGDEGGPELKNDGESKAPDKAFDGGVVFVAAVGGLDREGKQGRKADGGDANEGSE